MARVTLTRHIALEDNWPELQFLNEKISRFDERLLHHYQDAELADEKLESLRQMYSIYLENEQNYSIDQHDNLMKSFAIQVTLQDHTSGCQESIYHKSVSNAASKLLNLISQDRGNKIVATSNSTNKQVAEDIPSITDNDYNQIKPKVHPNLNSNAKILMQQPAQSSFDRSSSCSVDLELKNELQSSLIRAKHDIKGQSSHQRCKRTKSRVRKIKSKHNSKNQSKHTYEEENAISYDDQEIIKQQQSSQNDKIPLESKSEISNQKLNQNDSRITKKRKIRNVSISDSELTCQDSTKRTSKQEAKRINRNDSKIQNHSEKTITNISEGLTTEKRTKRRLRNNKLQKINQSNLCNGSSNIEDVIPFPTTVTEIKKSNAIPSNSEAANIQTAKFQHQLSKNSSSITSETENDQCHFKSITKLKPTDKRKGRRKKARKQASHQLSNHRDKKPVTSDCIIVLEDTLQSQLNSVGDTHFPYQPNSNTLDTENTKHTNAESSLVQQPLEKISNIARDDFIKMDKAIPKVDNHLTRDCKESCSYKDQQPSKTSADNCSESPSNSKTIAACLDGSKVENNIKTSSSYRKSVRKRRFTRSCLKNSVKENVNNLDNVDKSVEDRRITRSCSKKNRHDAQMATHEEPRIQRSEVQNSLADNEEDQDNASPNGANISTDQARKQKLNAKYPSLIKNDGVDKLNEVKEMKIENIRNQNEQCNAKKSNLMTPVSDTVDNISQIGQSNNTNIPNSDDKSAKQQCHKRITGQESSHATDNNDNQKSNTVAETPSSASYRDKTTKRAKDKRDSKEVSATYSGRKKLTYDGNKARSSLSNNNCSGKSSTETDPLKLEKGTKKNINEDNQSSDSQKSDEAAMKADALDSVTGAILSSTMTRTNHTIHMTKRSNKRSRSTKVIRRNASNRRSNCPSKMKSLFSQNENVSLLHSTDNKAQTRNKNSTKNVSTTMASLMKGFTAPKLKAGILRPPNRK
ncbi:hypothetical protein TrispH2_001299 [Trichoplax sp. H2]|nr:hypothetical protein TrispH2_001299 [Trichoplax sp. H2]|eukprot:RDD46273.1 hypothetical protein TrispH2_001299 [Trichoplax sp. H2]